MVSLLTTEQGTNQPIYSHFILRQYINNHKPAATLTLLSSLSCRSDLQRRDLLYLIPVIGMDKRVPSLISTSRSLGI